MNHEPLRYAHEEGFTDICFSSDGTQFITCGADGDIRIWSTQEGVDPIHKCIGEWSRSVCEKDGNLYIASANNDVQILTFPDCEMNGILDRFIAPINQISVSKNSEHLALAGEDMEVKLFDLSTKKNQVFEGLLGPCLSVSLTSQYLASSSGDGKLRVWEIQTKSIKYEVECFPKVNSFSNADLLCRIDFSPNGKHLAYPDKDTVVLLDTSDWSILHTFKSEDVTDSYSIVQFSPCGKYIAATTLSGDIAIFNVAILLVRRIDKHPTGTAICGLKWNPAGNDQIVYTDVQGQLGMASECTVQKATDKDCFTENELDFGDIQFESDDDNENAISVEKLKKEVMGEADSDSEHEELTVAPTPRPRTPEIPLQDAFMPTSTPEHLNPRYLCWNDVGIIKSYDEDAGKSIDIEFHNATFHNSMMIQNYQDYHLGSLSTSAVALANAKQIYVVPLSASSKEWVLKLNETEEIVVIGASEHLISFATNNYLIRVCSIFGTQRGVVCIPGPIVTLASYDQTLLVAYHSAAARKNDQCLRIKQVEFAGLTMEAKTMDCALSPESTLFWLGFTDRGTPAMMDSLGMLSLYPKNIWLPFCDTSRQMKNPSDGFFLTSIMESNQTIFGIKCRSSSYPGFTPKPTVSELRLEPPFIEPDTDKTQLEANLFTWSNLEVGDTEQKFTETGLKAFALACKNNMEQRAVELMEILANPALINLTVKYATRMNKKLVAEKLVNLASKLMEPESEVVPAPSVAVRSVSLKKKTRNEREVVATPDDNPKNITVLSDISFRSDVSLSESFAEETRNPFQKGPKVNDSDNPLSLTDKYAGSELKRKAEGVENKQKKKPKFVI